MHWIDWVVVSFLACSVLINIGLIGKPREPMTSEAVVIITIINAALIAGILLTHT